MGGRSIHMELMDRQSPSLSVPDESKLDAGETVLGAP